MSDLIRQNSENLELKTIPTSSKLTLLLLTVTILSDPNGLFVGADRQPGDDCSGSDGSSNQRLSYHEVKDNPGLLRCCPAIRCTAGTEAKLCDDRATTSCVKCLPGTYQSSPFYSYAAISFSPYHCVPHTQCTRGSRLLQEGNATANTVCECNLELGYHGKWPNCYRYEPCQLGFQRQPSGECKPCPINFHRSSENYTRCIPCSSCGEATQRSSNCTATHDTICGIDSAKAADGPTVTMVVAPIASIIVVVVVIVVFVYIYCKRRKHREGTIVSSSTPSTSSIPSNVSQEEGKLIPATELAFTGIHDVSTNGIYGQNCVPHSPSIPSLCAFKDYGCRISKREVEDLLPNSPSLAQTNQSITPESTSSIIELQEDNYEMKEEQNPPEARGAERIVTMHGGQNIYGQHVVINFYQQDKHSCDV